MADFALKRVRSPGLEALGVPGIVGIAILAFCGAFYLGTVAPLSGSLVALEEARDALDAQRQRSRAAPLASPRTSLDAFYRLLPSAADLEPQAERIFEAGRRFGVVLTRGSYGLVTEPGTFPLVRFEASYEARAPYYRIRLLLRELLRDMPGLAIDEIEFQRQQVSSAETNLSLKLSMYLRRE